MATTLSISSASAKVVWDYESVLSWGNAVDSSSFSFGTSLASGTGSGQADRYYATSGTLAGAASVNIDLNGALVDSFGNTINMLRVKIIYVNVTADTPSTGVYVGGAAANGFANWISSAGTFGTDQPKVLVRNNGCLFLCAPDATAYAVTAGTGDILKITNADGSNTATYNIVIVGASA